MILGARTHTHTHEVTHEELVENFQVLGTHAVYPTLNWWIAKCVLAAVFGGSNPLTISSSLEMFLAWPIFKCALRSQKAPAVVMGLLIHLPQNYVVSKLYVTDHTKRILYICVLCLFVLYMCTWQFLTHQIRSPCLVSETKYNGNIYNGTRTKGWQSIEK